MSDYTDLLEGVNTPFVSSVPFLLTMSPPWRKSLMMPLPPPPDLNANIKRSPQ